MQWCKHNQDGRCSSRETRRWEITSGVLQGQTPDPRDSKHYSFHYKERWVFFPLHPASIKKLHLAHTLTKGWVSRMTSEERRKKIPQNKNHHQQQQEKTN